MSTVTNVFKGVVLPAALAVAASGVLLSASAWASPQQKDEACEGAGGGFVGDRGGQAPQPQQG